jgi:hypothetical protein
MLLLFFGSFLEDLTLLCSASPTNAVCQSRMHTWYYFGTEGGVFIRFPGTQNSRFMGVGQTLTRLAVIGVYAAGVYG